MNRIIYALIFITIGNISCIKNTSTKKTRTATCIWTYQNNNIIGNRLIFYPNDSNGKNRFYMADTNSYESIQLSIPFLATQLFDMANPADSTSLSMNHLINDTLFAGIPGTIGHITISSLSMNLATLNFMAIVDGDTCSGSCTDFPF
ncbi:MAG: hypothetical protein IPL09_04920 [Bacteroidetes bacterium]|jgi:hypothetical protein|nr:hypothetical protein [Bacteroidota bacterium]MBK7587733.1 hypothetical protein [Bacteroidota bacterium]MBK8328810.1 hypothetical protein [Bacteroidota bacterium]MBK9482164.1 hypothetical protein [Bacteroidota bacterium]